MVLEQRRRADRYALEAFTALNAPHLRTIYKAPDDRRFVGHARFDAPVVTGDGYRIAPEHRLLIEIPDNYLARDANGKYVKSRIRREQERVFHPNVWPADGYFCYDDQFVPAKSLAEQLWAVTQIMQGRLINHGSPADHEADYFYLRHGSQILSQISPVQLRLPRGLPRASAVSLPRVA